MWAQAPGFMLRASELLPHGDGSDPLDRAIRPADVAFYKGGQACLGTVADEVVIQVRSSKTDQFGRGQARSHHRSGGDLCPVEALATLQALQPHRWRGAELEKPLFRYADRSGLDREGIAHLIKVAALAAGYPGELAGSHSLRKGGATAFFASTGDLERLKRYGGWTSDAVHAYLYEDHTAQIGISQGMIGSNVITLPSQKAQAADRPPVGNHQDRSDLNRGTLGSRSLSWAPDRRVSFCERAGSCVMEAITPLFQTQPGSRPASTPRSQARGQYARSAQGVPNEGKNVPSRQAQPLADRRAGREIRRVQEDVNR